MVLSLITKFDEMLAIQTSFLSILYLINIPNYQVIVNIY